MDFTLSRYVPHSDTTKLHYEQLLLDIRRSLPPGVYDNIEDIAEEVLAIVCARGGGRGVEGTNADIRGLYVQLERLLDAPLRPDAFNRLLQYGKLITDYVATDADGRVNFAAVENEEGGGVNKTTRRGQLEGVDFASEGPSSSRATEEDSETDEMALLAGTLPQNQKRKGSAKKSLKDDKSLSTFAFSGQLPGEAEEGVGEGFLDGDAFSGFNADMGAAEDVDDLGVTEHSDAELEAPKAIFDTVVCNPNYIKDTLRRFFPSQTFDVHEAQANRVVEFISQRTVDDYVLETQLITFLGAYDDDGVRSWIVDLCSSRWSVAYGLRYAACSLQKEKNAVMEDMRTHALENPAVQHLYQALTGKEVDFLRKSTAPEGDAVGEAGLVADVGMKVGVDAEATARRQPPLRKVDLQACSFHDERAPHRGVRATVPRGTLRAVYETHDEVILPPTGSCHQDSDDLISISAFPTWCHGAFGGVSHLNKMQSRVFDCAFHSDHNMLVCAPTGAGKTNVAMIAMLRTIQHFMSETGSINLRSLKMVYVAPMKALVQEIVRTFSERLEPLGLIVAELSGDAAMTQHQMAETQLIVTTPEKWDIVTRKSVELGVAALLKLLIIDEVHLLHNERGPVLEAIVARTILLQQLRGTAGIRLVGLSATLPNVEDVASFLQVDRQCGLFTFDSSYRPVPLQQTFCAIKRIKGMTQAAVMNRIVYDKVLQAVQDNEQVMIFVHSRKETEHTALYLKQRASEGQHEHFFVRPGSVHERELQEAVSNTTDYMLRRSIKQLLPHGFSIHHAGLSRDERRMTEELFASRHIKVLVCTSTLAWGVNLPANHVMIKGTRVFNGAKGESELLSALDVLQMFGRAGRVGFDATVGHAAIITTPDDLPYYLSLLNQQLPIESQMMKRVMDMLNAEIALGHVENTKEGVRWLQRTYLYVRMRKVPEVYGVRRNPRDALLLHHLENIVHTVCEELKMAHMIDYEKHSRKVGTTPFGRIASHCYVTTTSMATYLANLCNAMQDTDLFRVFSLSSEFANLGVRAEEQAQLKELLESAPIAVRDSRYTPLAKINILLQCFISRKTLEGLPLMSEMVYVKDSTQRILRALYEICLVREFGRTARQIIQLYAMVLHRQWAVESPVRQVASNVMGGKNVEMLLPILERIRVPWKVLRRWSVEDLAEKLGDLRRASMACDCIQQVPYYVIEAAVRPLTRSMLYVDVDITPDFSYEESLHGHSVTELLLTVEHINGRLLHHETVQLPLACLLNRKTFSIPPIVVPMIDPKPTHLIVCCVCPEWLASEATAAVCLLNTQLPAIAPALRELHQGSPVEDGNDLEVCNVLETYKLAAVGEQIFTFTEFYASQRELVGPIFDNDQDNIFVGMPPGGGKTVLAELFILQFLLECALHPNDDDDDDVCHGKEDEAEKEEGDGDKRDSFIDDIVTTGVRGGRGAATRKVLYITCHPDTATRRYMDWRYKFGEILKQRVFFLDDDRSASCDPLGQADSLFHSVSIVVATGASLISHVRTAARWLFDVTHIIGDHLHLLRSPEGRFTEECFARLQSAPYLVNFGARRARVLALSYPLISCAELGRWLKITVSQQYNFGVSYRQLRVRIEALELFSARARYETSVVCALKLLQRAPYHAVSCVLFLPHAADTEDVAKRILLRCRDFVPTAPIEDAVDDAQLGLFLAASVAYLHRNTTTLDLLTIIERVSQKPSVHPSTQANLPLILVCAFDAAWRLPAACFSTAIVCAAERLSVQSEEAKASTSMTCAMSTHRDLSASELIQMTSRAFNEAVVYSRNSRRWVWTHLLNDPLPLESSLRYPSDFCDAVNAAVAQGRAQSHVDVLRILQSHYFLYHLKSNPHFYGVPSVEDLPLFASDLADRVVQELREQGCVDVVNQDEEDGSVTTTGAGMSTLHATPRGMALAYHCITVDSMQAVLGSIMTEGERHQSPAATMVAVWRILAADCEELSATHLADAARVTEAAEYRALHTIARALPARFQVRYVDLDFGSRSIKVFLLVLAYCARFFASSEERRAQPLREHFHPFASAQEAATLQDLDLLRAIPSALATRLEDDLHAVLPAAKRIVAAFVEVLDHRQHSSHIRLLMVLSQCLHRRVWIGEDPLWQLPTVQRMGLSVLFSSSASSSARGTTEDTITLAFLQQKRAVGVAGTGNPNVEGRASYSSSDRDSQWLLWSKEEAAASSLIAEAHQVPRVHSVTAHGTIEELSSYGVMAMVVDVRASVVWAGESAEHSVWVEKDQEEQPEVCAEAVPKESHGAGRNVVSAWCPMKAERWWVWCAVRHKRCLDALLSNNPVQPQLHILALRALSMQPDWSNRSSVTFPRLEGTLENLFTVHGKLVFPLSCLENVADLDAVELVATVTSMSCYGVEAEVVVGFETEQ